MVNVLLGLAVLPAQAAFKSLYVFGDGLSATADVTAPQNQWFYGQRWSNGRIWVEVLAQRQGLVLSNANNNSYWDHNSSNLVTQIKSFAAPADVTNDLFIVWVCNADTFDAGSVALNSQNYLYPTNANLLSQTNHLQIITNLYAKGVRTLILPNSVDLSKIPSFNAGKASTNIHSGCVDYNIRFSNTINQARALCPGLKIYTPDFFTLLNNVLTNSAAYGLTNALSSKGYSIDAYDDPNIVTLTLTNAGTNYIFWDAHDPTAKFHEVIADIAQQLISPVRISGITVFNGSNRLDVVNVPVGLNGFVEGCTNLLPANWISATNITSITTTQSVFVAQVATTNVGSAFFGGTDTMKPADAGPGLLGGPTPPYIMQYYRLRFPYAWNWP